MATMSLEEITAIYLIKADRLKEAENVLASYAADDDGIRSYLLGVIYAKQQDYEKARKEIQKIPASSPYRTMAQPFEKGFKATTKSDPYAILKAGRREEAANIWEKALKQNPDDLAIWHNLAVLYYWHATHLEENGKFADASKKWQKAIGYWAGILARDSFWREWAIKRATACGVQEPDFTEIVELGFMTYFLSNLLSQYQKFGRVLEPDRVESYLGDVTKVREGLEKQFRNHFAEKARTLKNDAAEMYEQLLLDCSHELSVARLLERVKKSQRIVEHTNRKGLNPEPEESISKALEHIESHETDILLNTIERDLDIKRPTTVSVPSCGPMMQEYLNTTEDVQAFVNTVFETESTNDTIAKLKQSLTPTSTRLRFYLSPNLGRWLVMIDVGMFDKAIEGIKDKLQRERPREPLARNLRVLLAMACHDKVKYTSMAPEDAASIEALEIANAFAYDAVTDSAPFDFDIPRLIDDICRCVAESVDSGEISLHDGINLLKRLCAITPSGRGAICRDALEILLER